MPSFFYISRDRDGNKITGTEEAVDQDELISRLQARDLIVINVTPESKQEKSPFSFELRSETKRRKRRHAGISGHDKVILCRQLATLIGAGVTILQSLRVISKQVASKQLGGILGNIAEDMEKGLSLHEAMARHPSVFSDLWVNLVESGEASGNLAVVLGRLATYLERNAEFRRKIISSLLYPFILLILSLSALFFLTLKIIPTFATLFSGFDITLPLLTRALVGVSNLIRHYALLGLAVVIVLFLTFRQYIKTKDGKMRLERFLFGLPFFGEFFRALVVERFSSGMSTLVESGVPILYALEISERSIGNLTVAEIIHRVKEEVRSGRALSQPLEKSGFFEPMVIQMVAIGEEIGELSPMLKRINTFYQEYADTFLIRFNAMFEPLMLVFIGAIVGTMVVGMFLPIFQISQFR